MAELTLTLKECGITTGYILVLFGLISLYFMDPAVKSFVDVWNEYLESAVISKPFYYFPPISVLDLFGSMLVCKYYRLNVVGTKSWFEILFTCTLMQFGGTTIVSIVLLGHCPYWIIGRAAFPALLVAWWLTFYSPGDLYWHLINKNYTAEVIAGIFAAISSGHAIGSWGIDKALNNKFHVGGDNFASSYLLCILAGTVAACGGGLIIQAFNMLGSTNAITLRHTPPFFLSGNYSASATLNRCFILAFTYYYLINDSTTFLPSPKLSLTEAHSLMALTHVVVFLMSLHIPQVDIFQILSDTLLGLVNIHPNLKLERKVLAEGEKKNN